MPDFPLKENLQIFEEEFKLKSKELVDKITELIHEGNVRRIVVKDERGHTFLEIPLTLAAVGVIAAPVIAAVGALAAAVTHVQVVVERVAPPPGAPRGSSS
ncbi:MAG TPA: DUF4342 domain-containing protein [Bryobacteraceae bacterium]|jgi:hypothetical protein|nr:DUF4342 domain-containing protein [Bryobacteraceae bacterium]